MATTIRSPKPRWSEAWNLANQESWRSNPSFVLATLGEGVASASESAFAHQAIDILNQCSEVLLER